MATKQKTLLKALQPFAHGNVSAQTGQIVGMNPGDAKDLIEAGFAEEAKEGEPEQIQIEMPHSAKQPGDVVVDEADDLLGDGKAAKPLDNKAAPATRNKAPTK